MSEPSQPLTDPGQLQADGRLQLLDLTGYPRFGLRGPGAVGFLHSQQLELPGQINHCALTPKRDTILRLGQTEIWVLAGAKVSPYFRHWLDKLYGELPPEGTYPLQCQHSHSWLLLAGNQRALLLAGLCSVDLGNSAFPVNRIAQTRVAGISTVIAHHSFAGCRVFSLLADVSYRHFLIEVLEREMERGVI